MQDGQKIVPVIFLHVSMQAEILEAEVLQVVVVLVIGHKDPVDQVRAAALRSLAKLEEEAVAEEVAGMLIANSKTTIHAIVGEWISRLPVCSRT